MFRAVRLACRRAWVRLGSRTAQRPGWLLPVLSVLLALPQFTVSAVPAQVLGGFDLPRTELSSLVTVEEAEQVTRAHLERVQQFLVAGQWAEAVQTLRQVMETDTDRLLTVVDAADRPFVRYVRVRSYCHALLSEWNRKAPEALALYRQEVDAIAERWLREAAERHDEPLLARIAEQFFASSSGDEALLLLGEFALERGDYTQARACWEALHPALRSMLAVGTRRDLAAGRPLWLTLRSNARPVDGPPASPEDANVVHGPGLAYPDSGIPLAEIRARLVLVSILEGSAERAAFELGRLRELHPDERGTLAGREGKYVDLLSDLLEESKTWTPRAASPVETFGGAPDRGGEAIATLDVGGVPLWKVPLAPVPVDRELLGQRQLRVGEDPTLALSYFPLVVEGTVYLGEGTRIRAWDVETGVPRFAAPVQDRSSSSVPLTGTGPPTPAPEASDSTVYQHTTRGPQLPDTAVHLGVPRYTLTAGPGRLFAKMGSPVTRWPNLADALALEKGQIVGLDLRAQGRLLPGFPLTPDGQDWSFEGPPLFHGHHLYLAMRRQDDVRAEAHVACYDAYTGRLLWRRFICAAETPGQGTYREITHNLLTLDNSTLYLNTNLGAVAALDAASGRLRWLTKYPRALFPARNPDDSTIHFFRDLNPVLFDRDQLFVAPADCDRVFALDAISGQVLWSTPAGIAADGRYLLGTTDAHLLLSGEHLYWIDRFTGRLATQFPEQRSAAPGRAAASPRGYGRGILGQHEVYWPTRDAIYVFDREPQGTPWGAVPVERRAPLQLAPLGIRSGNLVAAGNVLLIAGTTELVALRNW